MRNTLTVRQKLLEAKTLYPPHIQKLGMYWGLIMIPPKIEDIPINSAPNPCAVVLSRKIAMKPWPKKVNVPKLNAMKSQ